MGAESSTSSSIEHLGKTLSEVERKLSHLERTNIQKSRAVSSNNTVLVFGRVIECRPWIHLTVGPVLGLIGQTFARVLIETDGESAVTVHVFEVDRVLSSSRFLCQDTIATTPNVPIAQTIRGLKPGKCYEFYFGGINGSDTLQFNAAFRTLPEEDTTSVKMVLCHKGRIDHISPSEMDLWSVLERKLIVADQMQIRSQQLLHQRELVVVQMIRAIGGTGIDVADGLSQQSIGGSYNEGESFGLGGVYGSASVTESKVPLGMRTQLEKDRGYQDQQSHTLPIHFIVHNGDFLSVEPVLRGKAISLLDLLLRPETSVTAWQREFTETEHMLADLYRQAFRNGSIRFILRRTGNIFLAGEGESGSATAAMLVCSTVAALNPPSVGNTTGDNTTGAGAGGVSGGASVAGTRSGVGSNAASVKSGGVSVNSTGAKSASASASAAASGAGSKAPLKKRNSEMLGDDVQAQRDQEASEMAELDKMRDELQMLLVAALVRMARRVYWSYMRQLWDLPPGDGMENHGKGQGKGQGQGQTKSRTGGLSPSSSSSPTHHEQCLASDRLKEESLVEMIRLRKGILAKTIMMRCLQSTTDKLIAEFGEEYKAADRVKARLVTAKEGLFALEAQYFNLLRNMKEVEVLEETISHGEDGGGMDTTGGDMTRRLGPGPDRGLPYGGAMLPGGYTRCNGAAVNVGLLGVVLLDTVWDCWLMPDGLTPRGYSFEPASGPGLSSMPTRILTSTVQPHIEMSHSVLSALRTLLETNHDHYNAAALSLALAPDAVMESPDPELNDINNNDGTFGDPPGPRGNTFPTTTNPTSTFVPNEHSVTSVTNLSQVGADDETTLQDVGSPPLPLPGHTTTGLRSILTTTGRGVAPARLRPVRAVLCLSSAPLVPVALPSSLSHPGRARTATASPSSASSTGGSMLQLPVVSPIDSQTILTALARWQQQDLAHAALLVAPREGHICSSLSSDPYHSSHSVNNDDDAPGKGLGTVGWIAPITKAAVLAERNAQQGLGLNPSSAQGSGPGRKMSAKKMRSGSSGSVSVSKRAIFEGEEGEETGVGEEDEDEGDEVGWDEPRCHLRMVALGSMDLAQQAGGGTTTTLLPPNYYPSNLYEDERADESMMQQIRLLSQYAGNHNIGDTSPRPGERLAPPSLGAMKKRFGFRFASDDDRVACLRRSFWEAVLAPRTRQYSSHQQPGLGPGLASGPGLAAVSGVMIPSGYKLSCITDTLRNVLANSSGNSLALAQAQGLASGQGLVQGMLARRAPTLGQDASDPSSSSSAFATVVVSVGPVMGRLTPTSASVLMEFTTDGYAELRCVDQLSGVAHCCQRRVFARQPMVFLFDNLSPNRGYDVYLAAEVGGGGLGDAHVKNAVYAMLPKETMLALTKDRSANQDDDDDDDEEARLEAEGRLKGWDDDDVYSLGRGLVRGAFTTPPVLPPLQPLPSKAILKALAARTREIVKVEEMRQAAMRRAEEERQRKLQAELAAQLAAERAEEESLNSRSSSRLGSVMGGLLKSSKSILSGSGSVSGSSFRGAGGGVGGGVGGGGSGVMSSSVVISSSGAGGGGGSVGSGGVSQSGLSKGASGVGSGSKRGLGTNNSNNNSNNNNKNSNAQGIPDDGSLMTIEEQMPSQPQEEEQDDEEEEQEGQGMLMVEQRPGGSQPGSPLGISTGGGVSISGDVLDEGDARAAVAMRDRLQGMGERKDRGEGSSQSSSAVVSSSVVISGSGGGGGGRGGGGGAASGRGVVGSGGGEDHDNDSSVVISDAEAADDSVTRATQEEGGGSVVGGSVTAGSIATSKSLIAKNEVPFAILGKPVSMSKKISSRIIVVGSSQPAAATLSFAALADSIGARSNPSSIPLPTATAGSTIPLRESINSMGSQSMGQFNATTTAAAAAATIAAQQKKDKETYQLAARGRLAEGLAVTRALTDAASRAWGGIDLIVHMGCSVDIQTAIGTAVGLLAQAEGVLRSSSHHNHSYPPLHASYRAMGQGLGPQTEPMHPSGVGGKSGGVSGGVSGYGGVMNRPALVARQESQRLVGQALEVLRNAYHLHWGASYMRSLLSSASHMFVSHPVIDVLTAFGAKSPRQLQRDLSPYCADQLLQLVAHLQHDYQEALWHMPTGGGPLGGGAFGTAAYGSSSGASNSNHGLSLLRMEYIAGGSVGLFTLRPDLTAISSSGPSLPGYYQHQPQPQPSSASEGEATGTGWNISANSSLPAAAALAEHLLARGAGATPHSHHQGGRETNLLSEAHFSSLCDELRVKSTTTAAAAAAAMGRNNPYIDAYTPNLLLVFSPLPLVTRDSAVLHGGGTAGAAFVSEAFVGLHYGSEELVRLLDVLSSWLEADPSPAHVMGGDTQWEGWKDASTTTNPHLAVSSLDRVRPVNNNTAGASSSPHIPAVEDNNVATSRRREVVIVCATNGPSYTTTIHCYPRRTEYPLDDDDDEEDEDEEEGGKAGVSGVSGGGEGGREVVITQLCIGPLIALPVVETAPVPDSRDAQGPGLEQDASPNHNQSYLFSSARKFLIQHTLTSSSSSNNSSNISNNEHSSLPPPSSPPMCAIIECERQQRVYHVADPLTGTVTGAGPDHEISLATVRTKARLAGRHEVERLTMRHSQISEGTWLQNAIILKAWRTVRVYLNGGNAKKALPVDVEADDLSEAIKVVCDFPQARRVFERCFELFTDEAAFGLPMFGGAGVVESMLCALRWVLRHLDDEAQSICPCPSTFVIRQLWSKYTAGYAYTQGMKDKARSGGGGGGSDGSGTGQGGDPVAAMRRARVAQAAQDGYDDADLALALAGTGLDSMPEADAYDFYETYMDEEEAALRDGSDGTPIDLTDSLLRPDSFTKASEIVAASMCADEEYFLMFLKQAIEAQALFEHFAYSYGLVDSWN